MEVMGEVPAGNTIAIQTDKQLHEITTVAHPSNASAGYLGITANQLSELKPSIKARFGSIAWSVFYLLEFFQWFFALSVGIGLANLMPLGPIDGGRMFKTAADHFLDQERSFAVWKTVSAIFIFLLLFNLLFPYVRPLL